MKIRFHASLGVLALVALLPLVASAYDGSAAPISRTEGASPMVVAVAGSDHSCGLKADGAVVCWGRDTFGQVDPDDGTQLSDTGMHAGPYLSVSAGGYHTCALRSDGGVDCWGSNDKGQAGNHAGPYLSVSAGDEHTCAVKPNGDVDCWGSDYRGQVNLAGGEQSTGTHTGPYLSVSAGGEHTCALGMDGGVDCWGRNFENEAGTHVGPYLSVSAGGYHTCAVRADSGVDCWGYDTSGQVDPEDGTQNSDTGTHTGPYLSVSAGASHTCAVKADGGVDCWGSPDSGKAGTHTGPYLSVSAGGDHTCAVQADGGVDCWGANGVDIPPDPYSEGVFLYYGQSTVPPEMVGPGSTAFGQIAAGNAHACDIKRDGTLRCWGDNTSGQAAPPWGEFTQVVAGDVLSCAIDSDGKGTCWGQNSNAYNLQLVSGTKQQLALSPINAMCSLSADGDALVRCVNASGNTSAYTGLKFRSITHGSGSSTALCGVSLTQPGQGFCSSTGFDAGHAGYFAGPWQRLESGLSHQCGLKTDGTLACWGDNTEGQTDNVPTGTFRALSVGYNHACAIRGDGTLACWGSNLSRQADAPVGTYVQVAAGNTFSCAIRSDGQRVCWGAAPGNPASLLGLPNGVLGTAYSRLVFLTGPNAPANPTFAHMGGSLPTGLTLSSSGVLSGTPTALGSFTFTVEAEGDGDFVATRTYTLTISDGTPPVIGYAFDPPAPDGSNGWYVGDVGVDWTAADPESAISSSTGCNDTTLSSDTAGASWTCSATSAGGSNSVTTAIVKRDATAPTITATATTAANANDWYSSNVTIHHTCSDATSGLAGACPADQVLSTSGSSTAQSIHDNAGNSATSNVVTVQIDTSAPTVGYAFSPAAPDGDNGWYRGNVGIDWTVGDAQSGIAGSTGCEDATLSSDTPGSSWTCTATNDAGLQSSVTSSTIKRDGTAPTLSPTVPSPLLRGQSYSASPNAADALSGIATTNCGALDTSSRGDFSTTCSATDNAGNNRTVQLDYTVSTTCANDGYKGTQLTWCRNICENGLTGATLDNWIHRWIQRYRDLPYCRVEAQ